MIVDSPSNSTTHEPIIHLEYPPYPYIQQKEMDLPTARAHYLEVIIEYLISRENAHKKNEEIVNDNETDFQKLIKILRNDFHYPVELITDEHSYPHNIGALLPEYLSEEHALQKMIISNEGKEFIKVYLERAWVQFSQMYQDPERKNEVYPFARSKLLVNGPIRKKLEGIIASQINNEQAPAFITEACIDAACAAMENADFRIRSKGYNQYILAEKKRQQKLYDFTNAAKFLGIDINS